MTNPMQTSEIVITPDPQILQVLTYLEMRPIDSLCELIDNSIDALANMHQDSSPLIVIELPTKKEVEDGTGKIRIRDNGPGMTLEQVENSLRAGYSSKQRLGSLGLFGVGFNIATGKLGRVTRLLTTRANDNFAIETIVDLVDLRKSGNFKVKATQVPKPKEFAQGTIVEISKPWGKGNQNFEYMLKLISLGRPKILGLLGRTYATLLRDQRIRVLVGDDSVEPHYHCHWDDSRYVEHAKHGKIPAVFRFKNKVIHTYKKCSSCEATIPDGESICIAPGCGSSSFTTQEEKISGWIGIQRYLDASHFGIDLIRSGRAIRIFEKEAFFVFHDPDSGDPVVDYPIDNREGRIIGEIHLDHVPVDPAKQNFERSSPEWRRAIEFLRGTSSLQPERPGADTNVSPVFKLYQGYRKVRTPGKRSMSMGKWLPGSTEPRSLNKIEVDELKDRFERREPGYFEDKEWWSLVEQADNKPIVGLKKCGSCHLECPEGLDECPHCGEIFEGKHCIDSDCNELISRSAINCPHCGGNQIPEIAKPWKCEVCGNANGATDTQCSTCNSSRGSVNPVSQLGLKGTSHKDDDLSIQGLSIQLGNSEQSTPIDVTTYRTEGPIYCYRSNGNKVRLPIVRFIEEDFCIYIDPSHPLFEHARVSLAHEVAYEIASYLYAYYNAIATKNPAEHSVTKIANDILHKYWTSQFEISEIQSEMDNLFQAVILKLASSIGSESAELYSNLSREEKAALSSELVRRGRDIAELSSLIQNGDFIHFLRPRGVLEIFKHSPRLFFDGRVWETTYDQIAAIQPEDAENLQSQIRTQKGLLLELAAEISERGIQDPREAELAKAACNLLFSKISL